MKKILCFILALMMALSVTVTTAMAAQVGRCPLCGAEDSFTYYSKDYGYCGACHRTNDTVCLTVTVHSDALSFDNVEVVLYQGDTVERMAVVPSGEQTILFSGLQRGEYSIAINMAWHPSINQTISLYNKENTADYTVYMKGDVNCDGELSDADAVYLLYNTFFGDEEYPVYQPCDFNGDGEVTDADAVYLLYYIFFGDEAYPLH